MKHNNYTEDMPIIFNKPYISLGGGLLAVGEIVTLEPCDEREDWVKYYCKTLGNGVIPMNGRWTTRFKFPKEAEFDISMMDELL